MPEVVPGRWPPSALPIAASLFLIGVGVVLLVDPDVGGRLFGLDRAAEGGGFERATGIRQVYLGALVFALWWMRRPRALGLVLISLAIIPVADFLIWLNAGSGLAKASEHLLGLLILAVGTYVLVDERRRVPVAKRVNRGRAS
ncbi:MAG TPA: DUF4267 domain-containing protein [Jiangellaceae bacterium]